MRSSILYYLIALIFIIGIYGTSGLVFDEYRLKHICPQILGIPACYIIMASLLVPLMAHLFRWSNKIYFVGTGVALTIATYGSAGKLFGFAECPKTSSGIPMCYISFLLFFTLVILKWSESRAKIV